VSREILLFYFSVPGTPYSWKRATQAKDGRKVTPKAMRDSQKRIANIACAPFVGVPPMFGPVKVFVSAVFAIPSSWSAAERAAALAAERYRDIDPDSDRILNQILDALKFVAFVDDCQVADCRCIARYGDPERTDVWLSPLPAGNAKSAKNRERGWNSGNYNHHIAKAPCGPQRWPSVIRADAKRLGRSLELVA
jgi:Holliday junction resolvase RusA-like endonuclease